MGCKPNFPSFPKHFLSPSLLPFFFLCSLSSLSSSPTERRWLGVAARRPAVVGGGVAAVNAFFLLFLCSFSSTLPSSPISHPKILRNEASNPRSTKRQNRWKRKATTFRLEIKFVLRCEREPTALSRVACLRPRVWWSDSSAALLSPSIDSGSVVVRVGRVRLRLSWVFESVTVTRVLVFLFFWLFVSLLLLRIAGLLFEKFRSPLCFCVAGTGFIVKDLGSRVCWGQTQNLCFWIGMRAKRVCCSWIDADEAVHWIGMVSGAWQAVSWIWMRTKILDLDEQLLH